MILYPKVYLKNVKKINIELLREHNIKALILDVDNTLIDVDRKMIDGAEEWCSDLKKQGIKMCILSNTSHEEKAKSVAERLEIPYIHFARKPFKRGFYRAKKLLKIDKNEEIAVVGDQLFTDIIGANRVKMVPMLVQPLNERDFWYTKIKRPLEDIIIRRYIKKYGGEIDVYK